MNPYTAEVLDRAVRHLASCYPAEGCGVILSVAGAPWFQPVENVVDRFHRMDPEAFPRGSATAYLFDPATQRRIWRGAAEGRHRIVAVVHSHCDDDASFSPLDREMAMAGPGQPLHPGVDYLVVSIRAGAFDEARVHRWEGGSWREERIAAAAL